MTQEQLRMQMLAGIITEGQYKEKIEESSKDSWLNWIENLKTQRYKSLYDFKEAIKQKAMALNTPEMLSWIEKIDPMQYQDIWDFKEDVEQKISSLN